MNKQALNQRIAKLLHLQLVERQAWLTHTYNLGQSARATLCSPPVIVGSSLIMLLLLWSRSNTSVNTAPNQGLVKRAYCYLKLLFKFSHI